LLLINEDIKHNRLISGLSAMGLNAEKFRLQLSKAIFTLMGFAPEKQNESLHKEYAALLSHVGDVDSLGDAAKREVIAKGIYSALLERMVKD